jgi:hypothetical protein
MMIRDVTTVINEIKNPKMVVRPIQDSVRRILGRSEWSGLTALHWQCLAPCSSRRLDETSEYVFQMLVPLGASCRVTRKGSDLERK